MKVKASQEQEVVIVGFTAPRGERRLFVWRCARGKAWRYAGRAGTGFTHQRLRELYEKLTPLITKVKPVSAKVPNQANTTWVKPKLVAEVRFTEWTAAGEMRHPVFLGLRTDKPATEVIKEVPKLLREAKPRRAQGRR